MTGTAASHLRDDEPRDETGRARPFVVGRGLTKRYGQTTVLDGLDIDIPERLFTTLLGPSGCGKTTMLRMIAGLERPDAGTLTLDGVSMVDVPPEKRPVHTVFQSYALFPHMTVAQNVAFPLSVVRRTPDADARVRAVLAMVNMADFADSMPATLSGGQQQRVALARAIVARPLMLLLDEPLSALDKTLRGHLQVELKRLQRQLDRAFLFVTHDQEEAFALSDIIYVMNKGRIVQRGTPEDIYSRPADAFCAEFIGEGTVLRGVVQEAKDGTAVIDTPLGPRHAPAHPLVGVGARGVLVLRPEVVGIAAVGTCDLGGIVTDTTFIGTGYRIGVECNGTRVMATAPHGVSLGCKTGLTVPQTAGFITRDTGER